MSDRPSIEKELADTQQTISQLEKDIKQLRDWISSNERAVSGMPESLRRITEDGITRARADLAQRDGRYSDSLSLLAEVSNLHAELGSDLGTLITVQRRADILAEAEAPSTKQPTLSAMRSPDSWRSA